MDLKSLFLLVACLVAGSNAACDDAAVAACLATYTSDIVALAADNSDLCTKYTASQTCITAACTADDGTLRTAAMTALDTAYTTASMDFSACGGSATCDTVAVATCVATSATDIIALALDNADLCTKYEASESCINTACADADGTVTESSMATIKAAYTAASLDHSTCGGGGNGAPGLKASATILHLAAILLLIFHLS